MKTNMIIQYFKTKQGVPFYRYSLQKPKKGSKEKIKLISSNPDLEKEEYDQIEEKEYYSLINQILPLDVI